MRPPPQHTRGYAIGENGPEERRPPHGLCLSPCHPALVGNDSPGLPLPRAWHSLANGQRSATPLHRPVGGDGDISRPQRDTMASLCTRHGPGERAAIRVWCSHVLAVLRYRNHVRTCDRLSTAPSPGKRKKTKNRSEGMVCPLTTGVLIRVRRGLCHWARPGCCLAFFLFVVRPEKEHRRDRQAQRLGGLEIDDKRNRIGRSMGRSAGLAPLRILSTRAAARR
jgi:hypothetical protein